MKFCSVLVLQYWIILITPVGMRKKCLVKCMFNSSFRATVSVQMLSTAGYELPVTFWFIRNIVNPQPSKMLYIGCLLSLSISCWGDSAGIGGYRAALYTCLRLWRAWVKVASHGKQRRCRALEILFFFLLGSVRTRHLGHMIVKRHKEVRYVSTDN